MNWLKKPKFLAAAFVILLIVVVFATNKSDKKDVETIVSRGNNNNLQAKLVQKDSDGDTLKDWEESLIGTDPNNSDSDGDGTSDGEEIRLGRNPLLAGPNDEVSISDNEENKEETGKNPDFGKFSENFIKGYIDLKKQGRLGTEFEDKFITDLLEKNLINGRGEVYGKEDILLIIESSKENTRAYAKDLNTAFSPMYGVDEYELLTFARAVETSDSLELRKLRRPAEIYKGVVSNLLSTPTPSDAVDIHVSLLNSFSFLSTMIEQMIAVENDPLAALTAVDGYIKSEEELKASLSKLNTHLLSKEIQ